LVSVGVLALQGDVREHLDTLRELDVSGVQVRTPNDLLSVDALIIPGGESTVISKLAKAFGMFEPVKQAIAAGLPTFGTCAGLIMLSSEILDSASDQSSFGALNVSVRRNAFGHQVDSFEAVLEFDGIEGPVHAAFIRAPIVERVGDGVEVLCTLEDGQIVAVRQGNVLGISFHPEISGETGVHRFFLEMINRS
jgi:5'-phosphate synthase pdxT subunit